MKAKNPVLTILLIATFLFINLGWSDVSAHIPGLETQGDILYVRQDSSGDCLTWATACDLQTALGTAVAGFDTEIWVAAGTYKPTTIDPADRTATFELKQAVAIYGGFPTTGEPTWEQRDWETNITTLSGDLKGDDGADFANNDENSYHVVGNANTGVTSSAVLDGFTVSGGNADGTEDANGGGMRNDESSPTLTNLIFSNNYALGSGGGMYNNGASNPTLTNVSFTGNTAYNGGGMYNTYSSPTLTNVTFYNNSASSGGGIFNKSSSMPILTNASFTGNTAAYGGGVYNEYSSDMTLTNVSFTGNTAYNGGGMYDIYSNPTLIGVTFTGNEATFDGGGMYNYDSSPWLTDVNFSGNKATNDGAGIYHSVGTPTLTNVTFTGNEADSNGGGMYIYNTSQNPTLTNVNFTGNDAVHSGGGMYSQFNCPTLTNVSFSANTATLRGGGLHLAYCNASPTILTDVTFSNNKSAEFGGGMVNDSCNSKLVNVTFSENSAPSGGGIVYDASNNPTLTNVTFSGNTATTTGGGIWNINYSNPTLTNVIVWGNSPNQIVNVDSTPIITYSVIQNGCPTHATCTNILTNNPLLGPLANNGGLTLTHAIGTGSSAIDVGNQTVCETIPTDQRGISRSIDGDNDGTATCDIGAYEYELKIYLPVIIR